MLTIFIIQRIYLIKLFSSVFKIYMMLPFGDGEAHFLTKLCNILHLSIIFIYELIGHDFFP